MSPMTADTLLAERHARLASDLKAARVRHNMDTPPSLPTRSEYKAAQAAKAEERRRLYNTLIWAILLAIAYFALAGIAPHVSSILF